MRYVLLIFFCMLPFTASASKLGNCDSKSYEITVRNGGSMRKVTLTPTSGTIQEFGPVVSYQIEGQEPVVVKQPDEEYCIWSGKIKIQRIDTMGSSGGGGFSLR